MTRGKGVAMVAAALAGIIANCKLQIANCKMDDGTATVATRGVVLQFTICNLQFAICNSLLAAGDPDDSVRSGRKALDSWTGYPWYDARNDDLRHVEPPPPPPNFNWPDLGPMLQVLAWIAIGLGLGAVLFLLWRAFLLRPRDQEAGEADAEAGHAARIESLPFPVTQGRRDLLAEARRHYEQGNYRQAIIYLFSFQLVRLDRQQIIHLAKGKTNRQYLREVGAQQTLRRIIEHTMVAFEDVFFGNHAIDRERFEACWSRVGEFERLTGET